MSALRDWATANEARHAVERTRLEAAGGEVANFVEFVDTAVAVHNVFAWKVPIIETLAAVPSAFGYALHACGNDPAAAERRYRSGQVDTDGVDWFPLREAVEEQMGVRRTAVYSALAVDGPGIPTYGPFTLVFELDDALVDGVLPFNSAEHYVDVSGVVNADALSEGAGTWSDRAAVATLKCEQDLLMGATGIDWPARRHGMLATESPTPDFVEVIVAEQLAWDRCREVRIASARLAELRALDSDVDDGATVSDVDRAELTAYRMLFAREERGLLRIVGV